MDNKLEFYVLHYNTNAKQIEPFNIFRSVRFNEGVQKLLDNFITFDDFVEKLEKEAMYAFWCKSEYEVVISDLFGSVETKIDIYTQIKPNLKLIANLIIENHNENL